jgi:hypothetical protein
MKQKIKYAFRGHGAFSKRICVSGYHINVEGTIRKIEADSYIVKNQTKVLLRVHLKGRKEPLIVIAKALKDFLNKGLKIGDRIKFHSVWVRKKYTRITIASPFEKYDTLLNEKIDRTKFYGNPSRNVPAFEKIEDWEN